MGCTEADFQIYPRFGSFYSYQRNFSFGISVADTWHALHSPAEGDVVAGDLKGWIFEPGRVAASASTEGDVSPLLAIHCAAEHGLQSGDLVMLQGMNAAAHNKPTRVTVTGPSDFTCDDVAYSIGSGASSGKVIVPASLQAHSCSPGTYSVHFTVNATALSSAKRFDFVVNVDIEQVEETFKQRASTGTLGELNCMGHLKVAGGQRVWVSGKNGTNEEDLTVSQVTLILERIGN